MSYRARAIAIAVLLCVSSFGQVYADHGASERAVAIAESMRECVGTEEYTVYSHDLIEGAIVTTERGGFNVEEMLVRDNDTGNQHIVLAPGIHRRIDGSFDLEWADLVWDCWQPNMPTAPMSH